MTQEEKDLLLRDLSARLPYGVILKVGIFDNGDIKYHNKKLDYHSKLLSLIELDGEYYLNGLLYKYSQFTAKPYLRPMSSMTEKERKEWLEPQIEMELEALADDRDDTCFEPAIKGCTYCIDWLNANYFDYRGLIHKNLAIEVTEENNPYK